jgi:hypothetical protein
MKKKESDEMNRGFLIWWVVIFFGWLVIIGPGTIAGDFFPVVGDVKLTAVQDKEDPDWVLISGSANRLRDNCSSRYMEWFVGARDSNNRQVLYSWPAPREREVGIYEFFEWRVQAAPPEVLMRNSFADIIHQCYLSIPALGIYMNFPWYTRTAFWN